MKKKRVKGQSLLKNFALLCLLGSVPSISYASLDNPQVLRGDVSFIQEGNKTSIQASDHSIIQYDGFSIDRGHQVEFIQPGVSSKVLNRVLNPSVSSIEGQLKANGQVFLVSPAGISFGKHAIVDVGSFFAAAGALSNEDFINGNLHFTDLKGHLFNKGSLIGDEIHLLGAKIENMGSIVASKDCVSISSGKEVWLGEKDGKIFVKLTPHKIQDLRCSKGGLLETPAIDNQGRVEAMAGKVLLSAGDVFACAIRNSPQGEIRSKDISLIADQSIEKKSQIQVSGRLDASDLREQAGKGGSIEILADAIGLYGATLLSNGSVGGGSIHVGGDYKGEGLRYRAQKVVVDKKSHVQADSLSYGDAGKIIFWSDDWMHFLGSLSAKGGDQGGDGGFIEVSGKKNLTFKSYGRVDVSASQLKGELLGKSGTLLLDPTNVTIIPGGGGADDGDLPDLSNATVGAGDFIISENAIEALAGNVNLIVEATNDITMNDFGGGTLATFINSSGSVVFRADTDSSGSGNFTMLNTLDNISFSGGAPVTIEGYNVTLGSVFSGGGDVTVTATNDFNMAYFSASAQLDVTAGNSITIDTDVFATGISLRNAPVTLLENGLQFLAAGVGSVLVEGALSKPGTGTLAISGSSGITLQGDVTSNSRINVNADFTFGGNTLSGNILLLDGDGTLTANGPVSLDGGTGQLLINHDITKATAGDLTLRSAFGGFALNISGNIAAQGVIFENTAFFDGADAVEQTIDAGTGTLSTLAGANLNKGGGTNLILDGNAVQLQGDAICTTGSLTINPSFSSSGNITGVGVDLNGDATLNSLGTTQTISAGTGTLDSLSLSKTSGNLVLAGDTGINIVGNVTASSGEIDIQDDFNVTGDVTASGNLNLSVAGTFSGLVDQRLDSTGGSLTLGGVMTKNTANTLFLGGNTGIDINQSPSIGAATSLTIEDDFDLDGSLSVGQTLNLQGLGTLSGLGAQSLSTSTLDVNILGGLTKASGDLSISSGNIVNVDGDINLASGSLSITGTSSIDVDANLSSSGNLNLIGTFDSTGNFSGGDIALNGNGVMSANGDQTITATGSLSTTGTLTKNGTNGNLSLSGPTSITLGDDSGDTVTVSSTNGNLIINDNFSSPTNLLVTGGGGIQFGGSATLTDAGGQVIDANTGSLLANSTINKANGDLTLRGDGGITLLDTVTLSNGSLTVDDDVDLRQNMSTSGDMTFSGNVVLGGDGSHTIDAVGGTLSIVGSLTKTSLLSPLVTLGGGTLISLNDDVSIASGTLVLDDSFSTQANIAVTTGTLQINGNGTLSSGVDQTLQGTIVNISGDTAKTNAGNLLIQGDQLNVDQGAASGNLSSVGDLTLTFPTLAQVEGNIIASGEITGPVATLTLDGALDQLIDAGTSLTLNQVNKTGAGNLTLDGGSIDLLGSVDVDGGSLIIQNDFNASGDLIASQNISLSSVGTFNGGGTQRVDAEGGTLSILVGQTSTNADIILAGQDIDMDASFTIASNTLTFEDDALVSVDLSPGVNLVIQGDLSLDGVGDQSLNVGNNLSSDAGINITKTTPGNLSISASGAGTPIDLGGNVTANDGNLTISQNWALGGNATANEINLQGQGSLTGVGDQTFTANISFLSLNGFTKATNGNAIFNAGTQIQLNGGTLSTVDDQVYNGDVVFGGTNIFEVENLTFANTVSGSFNTDLRNRSTATFQGNVGLVGVGTGNAIDFLGAGSSVFQGTLTSFGALHQASGSGSIEFQEDVAITGGNTNTLFEGNLILSGMRFSAPHNVQMGNTSANSVTLSSAPVTVAIAGGHDLTIHSSVDGAQDLTLTTGATGDLTYNGPLGSTTPLSNLTSVGRNITINGKQTVSGQVNHIAVDTLQVNGSIDPLQVHLQSGGDLNIASSVIADQLITLTAGGNLNLEATGSVQTTGTGSEVRANVTGNTLLSGDITAVLKILFNVDGRLEEDGGILRAEVIEINGMQLIEAVMNSQDISIETSNGNLDIQNGSSVDVLVRKLITENGEIRFVFNGGVPHTFWFVDSTSGNISIQGNGDVITNPNLEAGQKITTNGSGDISIVTSNEGDIYIGLIEAIDRAITLDADGSIQDTQDDFEIDIRQIVLRGIVSENEILRLIADGNIGGAALEGNAVDKLGRIELITPASFISSGGLIRIFNVLRQALVTSRFFAQNPDNAAKSDAERNLDLQASGPSATQISSDTFYDGELIKVASDGDESNKDSWSNSQIKKQGKDEKTLIKKTLIEEIQGNVTKDRFEEMARRLQVSSLKSPLEPEDQFFDPNSDTESDTESGTESASGQGSKKGSGLDSGSFSSKGNQKGSSSKNPLEPEDQFFDPNSNTESGTESASGQGSKKGSGLGSGSFSSKGSQKGSSSKSPLEPEDQFFDPNSNTESGTESASGQGSKKGSGLGSGSFSSKGSQKGSSSKSPLEPEDQFFDPNSDTESDTESASGQGSKKGSGLDSGSFSSKRSQKGSSSKNPLEPEDQFFDPNSDTESDTESASGQGSKKGFGLDSGSFSSKGSQKGSSSKSPLEPEDQFFDPNSDTESDTESASGQGSKKGSGLGSESSSSKGSQKGSSSKNPLEPEDQFFDPNSDTESDTESGTESASGQGSKKGFGLDSGSFSSKGSQKGSSSKSPLEPEDQFFDPNSDTESDTESASGQGSKKGSGLGSESSSSKGSQKGSSSKNPLEPEDQFFDPDSKK